MAATGRADRLAAADEHCLRGAAPLQAREVPVDELAIDQEAHERMVARDHDTSAVPIRIELGAATAQGTVDWL